MIEIMGYMGNLGSQHSQQVKNDLVFPISSWHRLNEEPLLISLGLRKVTTLRPMRIHENNNPRNQSTKDMMTAVVVRSHHKEQISVRVRVEVETIVVIV